MDPDWSAITLNGYRARWMQNEAIDHRYDSLQEKVSQTESISVPTLMIQGVCDFCDAPSQSEGLDRFFTGGYQRVLLDGAGHFPHRESPPEVAEIVNSSLQEYLE